MSEFIKNHQQKIVLSVGYLLVALLAFGLGRLTAFRYDVPNIRVEEVFREPPNYTSNLGTVQSASTDNCEGQIKGNINSKGEKIYHMPDGSFYARTNAEQCFLSEADAKAAGFRRSSR